MWCCLGFEVSVKFAAWNFWLFRFQVESQHFYFLYLKVSVHASLILLHPPSVFGVCVTHLNDLIWDLLHFLPSALFLFYSFLFLTPCLHPHMPIFYPLPVFSHSLVLQELVNLNGLTEVIVCEDKCQLAESNWPLSIWTFRGEKLMLRMMGILLVLQVTKQSIRYVIMWKCWWQKSEDHQSHDKWFSEEHDCLYQMSC